MIIASIDIGTNTILLLIVEVEPVKKEIIILQDELRIPRIGRGLLPGAFISNEKIKLLFETLENYKKIIEQHKCEHVIVTATNAFRIAGNGKKLAGRIESELGFKVNIVQGKDEAKLAYLGAISNSESNKNKLVIDIGGGSTEIVFGRDKKIIFNNSYPIGVVSLTERFLKHSPPEKEEIAKFEYFVNEVFAEINQNGIVPDKTIAIAGTPTTLACIKQNLAEYNESIIENSILTREDLRKFIKILSELTKDEIRLKYGNVVAGREDVLLSGAYILNLFLELFNLPETIVSTKGIRYGAILNYLMT